MKLYNQLSIALFVLFGFTSSPFTVTPSKRWRNNTQSEMVATQNHATKMVAMQDSVDALSENLINESEALFWTDKLLKTTEQIADDNPQPRR